MTSTIGGYARDPIDAKLLYAGPPATPKAKKAIGDGATSPSTITDVVEISDAAKAALANQLDDTQAPQPSLRARVDKLFQDAKDRGSFITFDSSKGGEWMDMSSFTDDELAQITNDKGSEYPQGLSDCAGGALAFRMKVALEPFENAVDSGDRRGQAMAINLLYDQMSPAVRQALSWTPVMMVANNEMLDGDTKTFGPFDENTVIKNLLNASRRGGLSFSPPATRPAQGSFNLYA